VDFGIVADREQLDDAWPLMEGIARALDEVDAAVLGPRPASAQPSSPRPRPAGAAT
jgi:hypothetical protein